MDGSSKTPIKYSEGVKEDLKAGEVSVHGSSEDRGSCLKRVREFIPQDYRKELVQLFKLAGPVFPLGFSVAASVRVGNALDAGNTEQAKLSCKVPIICAFLVACLVGAGLSIARNVIGYIFTSEREIIQRVADFIFIFGFMHIGDATAGVAAGVLREAGKQLIGALCNLVGFYFIGFPIDVSLMFAANMGIVGLWTGLTMGVSLQSIVDRILSHFCANLTGNRLLKRLS